MRLGDRRRRGVEEEVERLRPLYLDDSGFLGDFAITGEPTDLQIGVEAKGVLALRVTVEGTAAHGATPWLGENAVLRAIDVFRSIESLPFAPGTPRRLFDRPSINLGRILGGDAGCSRCPTDAPCRRRHPLPARAGSRRSCWSRWRGSPRPSGAALHCIRQRLSTARHYVLALRGAARSLPRRRADERGTRRGLRCGLVSAGQRAGAVEFDPARRRAPRTPQEWVSVSSLHTSGRPSTPSCARFRLGSPLEEPWLNRA